jgi:alkanesulfonate monooxygenase SsuD/methylene tetrahydromethanopterin reductase-like flavin-dependent oxidoreductase (luciferase family)
MEVGICPGFQNPGHSVPDAQVWREELQLVAQAEALGFDSVWGTEHHFTDYQVTPNPLQLLTWVAARTEHVKLGTMAVVLPWHDPVWVAEQVAVLDVVSGGRVILGLARGLGRVEFDGFRIPMDESRERFIESAQIIRQGLETGYVEYDGKHFKQPRRELRPGPLHSFHGRTYATAVSPESSRIMAELGLGILIIAQKPWETVASDLIEYQKVYREVNGEEAPPTIASAFVFCDPDSKRAEDMAYQHIGNYYRSVLKHYELMGDHFAGKKGYEFYEHMSGTLSRHGEDDASRFFTDLSVWGTPDQCIEKVEHLRKIVGAESFTGFFRYSDMSFEEAERNVRFFAHTVMPRLQAMAPLPRPAPVV